jgi:hypothetical protein
VKQLFIVLCVFVAMANLAYSQLESESAIFKKLKEGKDKKKAVEQVLKTPDEFSSVILFMSANVAFKEEMLEDSAFLLYVGQLRMRFDQKCFPAKGKGGSDPFIALVALSKETGGVINPAVMAEPKSFEKAIDRIKKWTPKAPKDYNPGYEYTERLSEKEGHEAAKSNRNDFIKGMSGFSTLLNDEDYFKAFKVMQAKNLEKETKKPSEEEYEKAIGTMKRIEKEKKLRGFSGG